MKNPFTLSREQVDAMIHDSSTYFPRVVRKGDTVTQRCDHPACRYEISWTVEKKGVVDWHEDLITHIFKEEHYIISAR